MSDITIKRKFNYLVVNDKYYEEKTVDGHPVFKEVAIETIEELEEKADKIAEHLAPSLSAEDVLREAVHCLDKEDAETLFNMLFKSKRKYKPKMEDGCSRMRIGNFYLPISGE